MVDRSYKVLFSGYIDISYSSFSIEPEDPDCLGGDEYADQINGLCGASVPGHLAFTARPKDAVIALEVQLHTIEPKLESEYTEVVEVSFDRASDPVLLCQWAHEEVYPIDVPKGTYRVRYSIKGFDKDYDVFDDEELLKPIDGQHYLIQLWQKEFEKDEIIMQTTEEAAYWHKSHGVCTNV